MTDFKKIYVELTNKCNLDCRTCMRNSWEEPMGIMEGDLFNRLMEGIRRFRTPPTIFFGGIGEPLVHPHATEMISAAKAAGCRAEMITNGILLTEARARSLIEAGLDTLWVSIDGARPESYLDVRLGDHLPIILENLKRWKKLSGTETELGIAMVLMDRNREDLPKVIDLAENLQVRRFSLSHVEAYTPSLLKERLYSDVVGLEFPPEGVALPSFETDAKGAALIKELEQKFILPEPRHLPAGGACPFLLRESISIRWDGHISPCLPLLHGHTVHFSDYSRFWNHFSLGSLKEDSLQEITSSPFFTEFHKKLDEFDFAPCLTCNACDLPSINGEDCFGHTHPACGGCLWARGFIVCP
ncbi:MAG TPA: radical SAM protein [Candidatus Mcinerneyibacteriales bacterium]|nr:radical SAM protein [Candidatus Mcinerneyibacteriales bacterium]